VDVCRLGFSVDAFALRALRPEPDVCAALWQPAHRPCHRGLIDTVDDGVTGFLFQDPSADALRRCLQRAFRTFQMPTLLQAMRRAAMLKPSGWDVAGSKYLALYDRTAALA